MLWIEADFESAITHLSMMIIIQMQSKKLSPPMAENFGGLLASNRLWKSFDLAVEKISAPIDGVIRTGYNIKVISMADRDRRSEVLLEREFCDCKCEVFDNRGQRIRRENPYERVQTGTTSSDFDHPQQNLFSDSCQLAKKISVSNIKRRKSQIEDNKANSAVDELRQLLTPKPEQRALNMKKQSERFTLCEDLQFARQARGSLYPNDLSYQANPEFLQQDNRVSVTLRPKHSALQKFSVSMSQIHPPKILTFKTLPAQIGPPTSNQRKKVSSSYAVKTRCADFEEVARATVASQITIVQRPAQIAQQSAPRRETRYEVCLPSKHPAFQPTTATTLPSHISELDESAKQEQAAPQGRKNQVPRIIVPIETESQYQKTLRKNEERKNEERSSKGQFSGKFGPMKIRNIVSVPNSENHGMDEQDSIVLSHFTPNMGKNKNEPLPVRYSQPPLFSKQQIEMVRSREVSAFDPGRWGSPMKVLNSASKTQRPSINHDYVE